VYTPKHFEQQSIAAMHAHIRAYPLATLVTLGADGLCANHIPMYLTEKPQPNGMLAGHVPRSNPVWRETDKSVAALVIFHGPNAYITPSWYPEKKETGRVVPTWNYTVVHARGRMRIVDDAAWLKAHLEQLTDHQEAPLSHPWAVADAPTDFTEKLSAALVGIEIPISSLVGKWKLSQNRPEQDKAGVVSGLLGVAALGAAQMAELVEHGTG